MNPALLPVLVAAALFIAILAVGLTVLLLLRARQERRLRRRLVADEPSHGDVDPRSEGFLSELADSGRAIEKLVDTDNETPRLLVQAGWRQSKQQSLYYLAQLLVPVCAALIAGIFWLGKPAEAPHLNYLMYFLLAVIIGLLAPRFYLRRRAEARRERIASEVPLFIHLLVLLFEAGLSTRQALSSLVREGRGTLPELNREFAVVTRQLDAGGDSTEVLRNLEQALQVSDLGNVLGVLRQVDRYGGEVREPLMETLANLEERRTMDMREKVNATSGRMTVVMVLFFFPALLIFVAGPAFVSVIKALGNVAG
ncbi:type II secretion system F family protein [Algiphilus sp.]|uniref:type II secretion system F family protein n=1 Tax=Algiphilus sp. TaxID=1872431 RepID=UPI003B519F61